MKSVLRRPSPAIVVSVVALLVALGGTAYAGITLGKNSVGSKQLKNNAVTSSKIKNGAVTTKKLKNGAITSSKINTSGLTVPHASSADAATNATNAQNATRATSAGSVDTMKTWFVTASAGQTVPIMTIGPFTYTGDCTGTASAPHAQTMVTTSQSNSAADSYAGESGYTSHQKNPWGPSDGALSVGYTSSEHSSDGTQQWVGPYDGSDTQLSGDGHTYVNTFASVGTKTDGADCVFTGHAVVITH